MPNSKVKQLEDLIKLTHDSLTREEFVFTLENMTKLIEKVEKKLDKKTVEAIEKLSTDFNTLKQDFINGNSEDLEAMKEKCMASIEKALKEQENGMNFMRDKIRSESEKHEGHRKEMMSEVEEIEDEIEEVKKLIPKIPDLPKLDSPEQLRDKLESLKGDNRVDKSAIKGLDELEKEVKAKNSSRIISQATRRKIRTVSLTDQCNGVTKAFTLPRKVTDVIGVFGTQFPVQFDPEDDWTVSGNTLTLGASVSAPETGQTLWALVEMLF